MGMDDADRRRDEVIRRCRLGALELRMVDILATGGYSAAETAGITAEVMRCLREPGTSDPDGLAARLSSNGFPPELSLPFAEIAVAAAARAGLAEPPREVR